jgi:hypothetical protein
LFSSFLRISFQSVKGASLRQHGNFILFVCACGSMAVDFLPCFAAQLTAQAYYIPLTNFCCACGSMAVDFLLCLRQHGNYLTN